MTESDRAQVSIYHSQLTEICEELTAAIQPILTLSAAVQEEATAASIEDILPFVNGIAQSTKMLKTMVEDLSGDHAADKLLAKVEGETEKAASILHHELRNPLGAIKGFGEMVEEDLEDLGDEAVLPLAQQLLAEVNGVLARLETVVTFSEPG